MIACAQNCCIDKLEKCDATFANHLYNGQNGVVNNEYFISLRKRLSLFMIFNERISALYIMLIKIFKKYFKHL